MDYRVTGLQKIQHDPRGRSQKESRVGKIRIYLMRTAGAEGPDPVEERLAHIRWRRGFANAALAWAGLPADTKVKWDWNAGCFCGCSPGLITEALGTYDVYGDIVPVAEGAPAAG